jgi:hypothetical protein
MKDAANCGGLTASAGYASYLHHAAGSFAISQLFMSAAMRSCPAFLMASVRFDPGGNFLAFASTSDALASQS